MNVIDGLTHVIYDAPTINYQRECSYNYRSWSLSGLVVAQRPTFLLDTVNGGLDNSDDIAIALQQAE